MPRVLLNMYGMDVGILKNNFIGKFLIYEVLRQIFSSLCFCLQGFIKTVRLLMAIVSITGLIVLDEVKDLCCVGQ